MPYSIILVKRRDKMAVVRNTFTTTLDVIKPASYTITGLTSETSTTSVSVVTPEVSTNFLTAIYQTLLAAGYTDASMNASDYSITVLGFKFFVVNVSVNTSSLQCRPLVYTHGISSYINPNSANTTYYINNSSACYNLSYKIIVRGDENCVGIWYGSYAYPDSEVPLIFVAKAKNLITGGDAYCWCNRWYNGSTSYYVYFREMDNLYTNVSNVINNGVGYPMTTYRTDTGNNTASKVVCEPILGYSGTYYIHSLIKAYDDIHIQGNYYKIGEDIYYSYGYKEGNTTSYSGSYLLMKVS